MSYKQQFAFAVLLAFGALAVPVAAQDPLAAATGAVAADTGFYGGVVLRQGPQEGPGVQIGNFSSAWGKFVAPTADETASRTLLFGGYRWANDLAFEAAFATVDSYALAPSGRGGVGLALGSSGEGAGTLILENREHAEPVAARPGRTGDRHEDPRGLARTNLLGERGPRPVPRVGGRSI